MSSNIMLNVTHLIESGGILLVALIVFAESGLLLGFFLPGDTLLFTAGIFAGQGKLSLAVLLPATMFAAIVGYQVGYKIGCKAGPRLFKRRDDGLFKKEYIDKAEVFFEKNGGRAVVLARFVPIVRTFISVVAGASNMDKRRYLTYNIIGSIVWIGSITLAGFWLGNKIPNVDKYVLPIVGVVIVVSLVGPLFHLLAQPKVRADIRRRLSRKP